MAKVTELLGKAKSKNARIFYSQQERCGCLMGYKSQYYVRNKSFMVRALLAAIDHNSHIFRQPELSNSGEKKYNKIYSKRSKHYTAIVML